MIKMFQGSEEVALYSIAYTCAMIVTILGNSMNLAWSPWLTENLHEGNTTQVRKWSTRYFALFMVLVTGVGFIAPELLLFMGGKSYVSAIYVLPPVMAGCIFQFAYTMYVNIETYEKKTGRMALATMTGALVNVILNYIFIPKYGYVAAAFTTLVGYGVLFLVHYFAVKKLKMTHVYSSKFIFGSLIFSCAMIFIYYFLYQHVILRVVAIAIVVACVCIFVVKYRDMIIGFIKSVVPKKVKHQSVNS
jgi:O-antigen/teichoic acid export membrane protein